MLQIAKPFLLLLLSIIANTTRNAYYGKQETTKSHKNMYSPCKNRTKISARSPWIEPGGAETAHRRGEIVEPMSGGGVERATQSDNCTVPITKWSKWKTQIKLHTHGNNNNINAVQMPNANGSCLRKMRHRSLCCAADDVDFRAHTYKWRVCLCVLHNLYGGRRINSSSAQFFMAHF